ncbi:hypothetical protein GBF38_003921 [Nibea albiflora]|uniref:Uncharacterized protein n=1 Tax=Nibea albiflora TaxID=240163 RepID=A0ACB7FBI7_NIBAL|nr:hypothetical protein GBF38_003921 [Nibea albiflora]
MQSTAEEKRLERMKKAKKRKRMTEQEANKKDSIWTWSLIVWCAIREGAAVMLCEIREILFTVKNLEDACKLFLIQTDRGGMVNVLVFLFLLDSHPLREEKPQCFGKLNNNQAHMVRHEEEEGQWIRELCPVRAQSAGGNASGKPPYPCSDLEDAPAAARSRHSGAEKLH